MVTARVVKVRLGGLFTYTALLAYIWIWSGVKEVCSTACEASFKWHGYLALVIIGPNIEWIGFLILLIFVMNSWFKLLKVCTN